MRSAAPIEGQLAFGIDLDVELDVELDAVVDVDEPEDQATAARPDPGESLVQAPIEPLLDAPPPPDASSAISDTPIPADPADPGDWRAILDFERGWSGPLPAKQRAIRERFGISSARYHQALDRALELPDALVHDPALVGRLRRVREGRRRKRFAKRVDADPQAGGRADPQMR